MLRVVVLASLLVLSSCTSAKQPAESSPASRLTGVWVAVGTFEDPAGPPPWSNTPWPSNPPFTEWGAEQSRKLADITNVVPCQPGGPLFAMQDVGIFPIEILEAADRIVIKPENGALPRRIFTDGRSHPSDLEPSWMGHSIGHWEGDELVVDTTHIAPSTITNNGLDHSADIHMVERYKLSADGKRLEATQWFEDPRVLDNNGARFIAWAKHDGQYVYPYECDPSFALEYQQAGQSGPGQ